MSAKGSGPAEQIFQVIVSTRSNKKIAIKFKCTQTTFDSTTTLVLKKKIIAEDVQSVDTDEMRLVFGSTQMDDEKTFSHYGIEDMSLVKMISRMLGGQGAQSP